jgi:hypothetical protein
MRVSHKNEVLPSLALERLRQFVRQRRVQWESEGAAPDFESFERALHEHIMALEQELIAEELSRYDVDVEEVEVAGTVYRQALTSPETYLSPAGPVTVERHLYRPKGRSSKSICPLELRAGIVRGLFTPRAARQGAFAIAHLTPREAAALFVELGGMAPSHSTLDRLPKELSAHWETQREGWEEALRAGEIVPDQAAVLVVSLDGVMAPMKNAGRVEKRSQPDRQASGPAGYREVGCGTVALHTADGIRLSTVRYGRMPEYKKATLCQQLQAECQSILTLRPDLKVVKLADGAKENWRFLDQLDLGLPPPYRDQVEQVSIVDFCHAAQHLKQACDAIWNDDAVKSKAKFECLRTLLKEQDSGVELVIRSLKHHFSQARGRRRERIETELTYFRNQRHRMHYAHYLRQGLPIASGVVEAACKTLVTQRLKQSGMSWTPVGGQAILTLRSLIQSRRWQRAWALLHADFRKPVVIVKVKHDPSLPQRQTALAPAVIKDEAVNANHYFALPLAA